MAAVVQPILAYFGLQNLCIDPTAPAAPAGAAPVDSTRPKVSLPIPAAPKLEPEQRNKQSQLKAASASHTRPKVYLPIPSVSELEPEAVKTSSWKPITV